MDVFSCFLYIEESCGGGALSNPPRLFSATKNDFFYVPTTNRPGGVAHCMYRLSDVIFV